MVEVPKVVSHIQNIISENPRTLLTGKVMGDIFAREEKKVPFLAGTCKPVLKS